MCDSTVSVKVISDIRHLLCNNWTCAASQEGDLRVKPGDLEMLPVLLLQLVLGCMKLGTAVPGKKCTRPLSSPRWVNVTLDRLFVNI